MKHFKKKALPPVLVVILGIMLTLQPFVRAPAEASSGWTVVGGAGFSNGAISYTSLVIDASGTVYVAYEDEGYGSKATVMKYSGSNWEMVGSPVSSGRANWTSLAVYDNTPYLAYRDVDDGPGQAKVMKYDGSDWVPVGNNASDAAATFISLAIDGTGTPCIAYQDWNKGGKITVKKYYDTGWEPVGNPGFSGGEAEDISLDIDSSGTPYVAYRDWGTSHKATVMKYNGTGWEAVGSPGFSAAQVDYISLALDGNGNPYLVYQDYGNIHKATVMKYNGTGWEAVGSAGISAGQADSTSLAIDSGGTPYVAYIDWANDGKTTVLSYNGSDWFPVGSPAFSVDRASWASLALDGDGNPYLAYRDGNDNWKATVMRYMPDTTAPQLTAGGVSRHSDSEAAVKFTSDEAGQYYYQVVAAGDAAPAIDSSGPGTACGTSEETINLTSLSAGGHDIYIIVKDEAGNVSDALRIAIPALLSGVPVLSATPGNGRVSLSWTPVEGSVSYSVYQSTVSGAYGDAIASVADTIYEYEVINLTNGTTYYFKVNAVDAYGTSTSSNEVQATPRGRSSGGSGSSTPVYRADVSGGQNLPVTINSARNNASVNISQQLGSSIMSGGHEIITMPSIAGVSSYTLGIPVAYLSTPGGGTLTFRTGVGSITLPAGMMVGIPGAEGKKAAITIGVGDKSGLSEEIRYAIGDRPLIELSLTLDGEPAEWNNPSAPVTISIPYEPTAEELAHPESIVIWYIDGNGNAVCVPNGHYDPVTGTVTFAVTHFSRYAVAYNPVSFSDVPAGAWYAGAVSFIAARDITSGTSAGRFNPGAKLTRGEFIVMLMKAYAIAPDANPVDNFSDAGNTWYTGYLAAAKRLGISSGIGNNQYAPDKEITRQEMFTLLYNSLKIIGQLPVGNSGKTLSDFTDAGQIAPWAKDAMKLFVKTGIVGGSNGKLTPQGTTTRAEMAQVLNNLLGK